MQEGNKPALDASSQRTTGNPTHILTAKCSIHNIGIADNHREQIDHK